MLNESQESRALTSQDTTLRNKLLFQFLTLYRKRRLAQLWKCADCVESHIELFVSDCMRLDQPAFNKAKKGNVFVSTPLGKFYFNNISRYIEACALFKAKSPPVKLFYSACKELGLLSHQFTGPSVMTVHGVTDAELLNRLVEKINTEGKKPEYRKKNAQYIAKDFRRFRGLVDYVDSLFENVRSRLIVIRIDLKYRSECADNMPVGQAQSDLKHFFNNMRSKSTLFDDLVGYIWKLESSRQEREHFHVVLFFTNDQVKNDGNRGELIGEYWSSVITQGRGEFFNCNRSVEKVKQKHLCLGRIEYFDNRMRFNMLYLLAYLCKYEQAVIYKQKPLSRIYGRGEMPAIRNEPRGRKRSVNVAPQAYLSEMCLKAIENSPGRMANCSAALPGTS